MKRALIVVLSVVVMSFTGWQSNFDSARQIAKEKHKLIMLNFSGSDWCGPCIRMRNEIFNNEVFIKMADTSLVLVNADFPRNKKNQLGKDQQKQNEKLADKYDPGGKFPYTLLLDADGKIVKSWEGLPKANATEFTKEVKSLADANK